MSKIALGMSGFGGQEWPSLGRTERFYRTALAEAFDLQFIEGSADQWFQDEPDAVVNFGGNRCWRNAPHRDAALVFGMHGGPILNHSFLWQHLDKLETSDVLLVNCQSDIQILDAFFDGPAPQIVRLPLPVDRTVFHPMDRMQCREALGVGQRDLVIGFVARLVPQKNLHRLLGLLANLKRSLYPRQVSVLIVGNFWVEYPVLPYEVGVYPERIKELVEALDVTAEIDHWSDQLDAPEMALAYNAMDVLFHPTHSIDENFGYVPIEAMACGTPVIGTAYGGLKDSIEHGETGFLLPTWPTAAGLRTDFTSGEELTLRLLNDEAMRQRMGEAGVDRVTKFYDGDICADILTSAVETAVNARRQGQSRGVQLAGPHAALQDSGYLPPVEIPWEHYLPGVAQYAGSTVPIVEASTRLKLAAPVVIDGPSICLADPAWPASYTLDESDLEIVKACTEEVSVRELEAQGLGDRQKLTAWMEAGLLVCRREGDAS